MIALAKNQFYLVLEHYDAANPPQGILIVSGKANTFTSPYYWSFDSTTGLISQNTAVAGTAINTMFIPWSDLLDYTGDASQVSGEYGSKPTSRKYFIMPAQDITAGRIYISKTPLDGSAALWENWKVNSAGVVPSFCDDSSNLTSDYLVDKAEFTYLNSALTINTTTVDFLSIPMTVEATFNVAPTWGSVRGPMGVTSSLKTVAAAFTNGATKNGVNWTNLNAANSGTVNRVLSPFRYLDTSPSDASSWNSYFDAYIEGLTALYTAGFQYPVIPDNHGAGIYYGKVKVSDDQWVVDGIAKDGTTVTTASWFTIDPSTLKGNSSDVFAVVNDNTHAREIYAAINRGIAHLATTVKGWGSVYGVLFPSSTAVSNPTSSDWTPSEWSNENAYYPTGTFGNNTAIVANEYSNLLHQQSIVGTASNQTGAAQPSEMTSQRFCYGFSVDDIWVHGSAMYGQGASAGTGSTLTATVGIFAQE